MEDNPMTVTVCYNTKGKTLQEILEELLKTTLSSKNIADHQFTNYLPLSYNNTSGR